MVQCDPFRLEFAKSKNDIQNPKSMPERSPSSESALSDLDELFLHEVDEMENKAPEMGTNDIDEMENIAPEKDSNDMDEIENIAKKWLPLTRRTLNLIDLSHSLMMLFRISF